MSDCPCPNQSPTTCPCEVVETIEISDEETALIERNLGQRAGIIKEQ